MSFTRLDFLKLAAATGAGSIFPLKKIIQNRRIFKRYSDRPVIIASRNGLRGVEVAYNMIVKEGSDPLDAAIEGVKIQELDPYDHSVGIGGLPNEEGVVQLDASCMHGPTKRAGSVAALEDIATPSLVAKAIMEYTDHIMLVGPDAKRFALNLGFEEENLLTERSRQMWLRWRSRLNPHDNWLDVEDGHRVDWTTGTVHISAMDANGDIASITSTSGLSYKIPGRVGDSPIVGAGQYCDNNVGAAGSTGRGEANIKMCGAFFIVEQMRLGQSPEEACLSALERVVETTEDRLLDDHGRPRFNIEFYALHKSGEFGGARMYGLSEGEPMLAVADPDGARLEPIAWLYSHDQRPG
jgi:N4-(beta-N-acetylglucosaminyl)-L-asparaginase